MLRQFSTFFKFILLSLIAFLPLQLTGAISCTNTSGTAVNPAGTTFSWSHTVSAGSDGCLVVIILSPAGPTTSTVTYNGTSMTKVATYSTSGVATGEWTVWRLLSPSTGANTVAVTLGSGNWNTCSGAGFSFTGASGVGNTAMNNTAAVGQTTSVTISSNSMIIGSVFSGNNTSATLELPDGTSSTISYNHNMSNYSWGGVSASLSSGSKTIQGTSTATSVIMGVEVQEAASCSGNVKANNTTNLNATGSWSCSTVPTSTTAATWESTVTGANTTSLGGNVSCLGVVISNPGGLVTINSGSTLSIYSSGIDMSASTQSFTMNNAVALAANQSWTVNTSRTLTASGVVSGSYGITKAGAGTLTLSGTNTFTGGLTHNAGTLNINAAAALGTTAGTYTVAASTTLDNTSGGSITTSNYPMTINGSFTFTGTNSLNLGTAAKTLGASPTITVSANTLTIGGAISGSYGITKAGSGTLALTGTNTFTGGVTHNAGTLNIGAAAALGTTAGTFTLAASTTIDNTSGGSLTTSNYPMTINGSFTFTGTNDLNLGTGAKALGATPTITVSANTLTLGGVISGAYGITKVGSGTLALSGANTYSGTTTITAGTVQLNAAGVISNSSNVVMNGGTLSTGSTSGYSETVGTLTLSANSTIALGTGSHNLNFAASNGTSWTGGTLLQITGWTGSYNGTTGTAGKVYTGSSAELSAAKLSQIYFKKAGGGQYTATQLSDGEIVPTATLPVELVYFKGESGDLVNHLYWLTASEVNSNYFDILRSSNGIDFEIIGNHKAAGYSQDFIQYKFDDLSPLEGINYYKLIEYDFDGSKQSSEIVALVGSSNKIEYLKTYPVPTSDQLNVVFSSLNGGIYYLKVYTMEGKELYTALVPTMVGENAFKLYLGAYPEGTYIVKLTDNMGQVHSSTVARSN